jgi:hypothetical protein
VPRLDDLQELRELLSDEKPQRRAPWVLDRTFNQASACAEAAQGNGLNLLIDAMNKGEQIRTTAG